MPRDYKSKGGTGRGRSKSKPDSLSPAKFLLAGFSLGVIAAAIVYYLLTPAPPKRPDEPVPMATRPPPSTLADDAPATRPADPTPPRPTPAASTATDGEPDQPGPTERLYAFWELLKNYEVIIPEDNERLEKTAPVEQVEKPGTYFLQVGAFRRFEDADRLKAQLALSGIECKIQRVVLDDREIHRVRIGPNSDLTQINALRRRLAEQNINVLLIRIAG